MEGLYFLKLTSEGLGAGRLSSACLEHDGLIGGHLGSLGLALQPEHCGHGSHICWVLSTRVAVWTAQPVLGMEVGSYPLPVSSSTESGPPGLPQAEGVTPPALGLEEWSERRSHIQTTEQVQTKSCRMMGNDLGNFGFLK